MTGTTVSYTPATPHSFHIPVMGTGFTIDTPLRVARYGISSVVSLVDDTLLEHMRQFHARANGLSATPIRTGDPDARARRITQYLDLLSELVLSQAATRSAQDHERYLRLLPDGAARDVSRLGGIDVNIMTKLDRSVDRQGKPLAHEDSDALAAFRGFAKSTLQSAMVLSAGINRKLYEYMAQFSDFFPDADGALRKTITLKVSDYRSAAVQGKFLARLGIWVSEFRIESGLNCGGHAFGGSGELMGPILAMFQERRDSLRTELGEVWAKALRDRGMTVPPLPSQSITAQGGVGIHQEHRLLLEEFSLDRIGWGTPFLLVPEVVTLDDATREALAQSTEETVQLKHSSPLGLPFWTLRSSGGEQARRDRIAAGSPGSPCPKGHLADNREFTEHPLCVASRSYQAKKLAEIDFAGLPLAERDLARSGVLQKSCICHDLSGAVTKALAIDPQATPLVCPGPNIVNFSKTATLEEMVDHIYGRAALPMPLDRPHMFVREFQLAMEHLARTEGVAALTTPGQPVRQTLLEGLAFYEALTEKLPTESQQPFAEHLRRIRQQLHQTAPEMVAATA